MNRLLRWLRRDPVPESDPMAVVQEWDGAWFRSGTTFPRLESSDQVSHDVKQTVDPWAEALADPGFKDRLRAATDRMDRGQVVHLTRPVVHVDPATVQPHAHQFQRVAMYASGEMAPRSVSYHCHVCGLEQSEEP